MKKLFFSLVLGMSIAFSSFASTKSETQNEPTIISVSETQIEDLNTLDGCSCTITVSWQDNDGVCHKTQVTGYASTCTAPRNAAYSAFNAYVEEVNE